MRRAESGVRWAPLVWVTLALAGCATALLPLPIVPHLEAGIPPDVPSGLPRLGVGPFADGRSASSRRERLPPLRLHWWGVAREGEVQTGDGSFAGHVAEGVRRDALATLARSGAFSEVRSVQGRDLPADLDLLLMAEVEELIGVQQRHTAFDLLHPGFLRRDHGEAVGIVRIHYRVRDRDGIRWEERLETWQHVPDAGIERAALDAMAVTNERLAHQLHRVLAMSASVDLRRLPVRVLDGCGLGRKRVLRMISDASEILEREAAIELAPAVQTWTAPRDLNDADDVLDAVRGAQSADAGIVLALLHFPAQASTLFEKDHSGVAEQLGGHAAIACRADGSIPTVTVVHEIAHLFGGVHVSDRSSLMSPVVEFDSRFFDPLNRRILQQTRDRPFGAPLPDEMVRALQRSLDGVSP